MAKVFLDVGHGAHDPGAVGNGLQEKNIALSVTLKIGDILRKHGVSVSYSRTTDVFLELASRATKANSLGANVFVSIHCNSFSSSSAKGVETYSYPGSTTGAKLSKNIQDSIIASKVYTANRGTKTANYAVLRLTKMPAALVELAFISNAQDADILRNRQNELAVAVAKGILSNLGIAYNGGSGGSSGTLYKVQVGAFSVKANADSLVNEPKSKGYSPIVVQVGGLYKVQVGAFSVKANADSLVRELKAKGYEAIVVSS
ncbi:sporulation-specific N-acetylmuramoyl-L-alanine amidase CwlC [Gottschalkia acidurici 9a]|uniref:Sporulation-specific N-acetylmuramoyl-L-alanine amidase CwlC n=1 Tax=Gottschalkia acidurici (strain ATCC 7906 / DSM 604 / BCRC 14475 / CIP 104303 / KCTC 5404 / NCIMB 10678 / 9a) TaxID=1128398 RepID=K0B5G6_GOTA9|nr:N-acetylmuramoyl-L-alanine amidase [Gottschalkia acidurici]AFS79776.1 sporulation-specific N-acetylmuramoyl-L-alanine amidase CwlC [Gottschalkia acidurici 9a]